MKTETVNTKLNASLRLAMLMLTVLFGIGTAQASTFTVTNTNDSGAGSLRQATNNADVNPGSDTINFNLPNCPCTINTIQRIILQGGLTINGLGAKQLTVSGDGSDLVFIVNGNSANIVIDGLTITGGNAFAFGGGGINTTGTVVLKNSVVTGNHSSLNGGGILNSPGGILTISNSTVSGNTAEKNGGGIFNAVSGTLIVNNSTVSGNTADGVSSITDHSADGDGGGIYNAGSLNVTGSTIVSNHSGANAVNASTTGVGGGIYAGNFETINNTIVAGNVHGSIFTFNNDDIFFGTIETANNNLIGDAASSGAGGSIINGVNGNIVGNNGVGTIDINTVLDTTLADNGGKTPTHALVPGSPAIDAGSNAFAVGANGFPLTTDQRGTGFPRIAGGTVDIGAFEASNTCGTVDTDGDGTPDGCDADDDNDGVLDANDAFPIDKNESIDTDHDGIGNNADLDDDGDGQKDADELACGSNPLDAASKSPDSDGDNIPNCVEANTDTDGDGVADAVDNCPLVFNPDQADFDGDGIGDTCDQQTGPPKSKEQCQNNGWLRFNFPRRFKNQGDCFKFIAK